MSNATELLKQLDDKFDEAMRLVRIHRTVAEQAIAERNAAHVVLLECQLIIETVALGDSYLHRDELWRAAGNCRAILEQTPQPTVTEAPSA